MRLRGDTVIIPYRRRPGTTYTIFRLTLLSAAKKICALILRYERFASVHTAHKDIEIRFSTV